MTFPIERGGQARSFKGATAKRRVQREMHSVVLTVQGDRTVKELAAEAVQQKAVMSWWFDLRKGHLPVYGSLLRFIDISIALGTPRHVLQKIPAWLYYYINERCDTPAITGEFVPAITGEYDKVA